MDYPWCRPHGRCQSTDERPCHGERQYHEQEVFFHHRHKRERGGYNGDDEREKAEKLAAPGVEQQLLARWTKRGMARIEYGERLHAEPDTAMGAALVKH